ncbi:MAG: type II toxin-antitoxin system HicA family toxin [Patescibacteria group bacterium]
MPSLSELPGEIKRKQFINALRRIGFVIDEIGGNGSHYKAVWPRTHKSVTIPAYLPKQVLKYILKEIESQSGITWEDIQKEL